MDFYEELYISPAVTDPHRIKKDLMRGKGHLLTYVLVLVRGPENRPQLEIMHCANLQQKYYRDHPPLIVGICEGKEDAFSMVEKITNESFALTGQWDPALYLAAKTGLD